MKKTHTLSSQKKIENSNHVKKKAIQLTMPSVYYTKITLTKINKFFRSVQTTVTIYHITSNYVEFNLITC